MSLRPHPTCPLGLPPIRLRASSVEFSLIGIRDEGVELPNSLVFAGPALPPHCPALSFSFSALSLAISRSLASNTSLSLSI